LEEIKPLGQGAFGSVYLAEDPSDGKKYVVKEVMTSNKNENLEKLLLSEPDKLSKLNKYTHPNLQNLITWFRDPHGTIVTIIEYRKG
jgi:serine/threonine protein kinase